MNPTTKTSFTIYTLQSASNFFPSRTTTDRPFSSGSLTTGVPSKDPEAASVGASPRLIMLAVVGTVIAVIVLAVVVVFVIYRRRKNAKKYQQIPQMELEETN